MPRSSAPFPSISLTNPSRFEVVAERTCRRSRRSHQGSYPQPYAGCKAGSPSAASESSRTKSSGRAQDQRCPSTYLGRFRRGNWAFLQKCAPGRRRCRERMGWQIWQTWCFEAICSTNTARGRTGGGQHAGPLEPNRHALPTVNPCTRRPAVLEVVGGQRSRRTIQARKGRAFAHPHGKPCTGDLALEGPNNAVRPGRQGEGSVPCRSS